MFNNKSCLLTPIVQPRHSQGPLQFRELPILNFFNPRCPMMVASSATLHSDTFSFAHTFNILRGDLATDFIRGFPPEVIPYLKSLPEKY